MPLNVDEWQISVRCRRMFGDPDLPAELPENPNVRHAAFFRPAESSSLLSESLTSGIGMTRPNLVIPCSSGHAEMSDYARSASFFQFAASTVHGTAIFGTPCRSVQRSSAQGGVSTSR